MEGIALIGAKGLIILDINDKCDLIICVRSLGNIGGMQFSYNLDPKT